MEWIKSIGYWWIFIGLAVLFILIAVKKPWVDKEDGEKDESEKKDDEPYFPNSGDTIVGTTLGVATIGATIGLLAIFILFIAVGIVVNGANSFLRECGRTCDRVEKASARHDQAQKKAFNKTFNKRYGKKRASKKIRRPKRKEARNPFLDLPAVKAPSKNTSSLPPPPPPLLPPPVIIVHVP